MLQPGYTFLRGGALQIITKEEDGFDAVICNRISRTNLIRVMIMPADLDGIGQGSDTLELSMDPRAFTAHLLFELCPQILHRKFPEDHDPASIRYGDAQQHPPSFTEHHAYIESDPDVRSYSVRYKIYRWLVEYWGFEWPETFEEAMEMNMPTRCWEDNIVNPYVQIEEEEEDEEEIE